MNAASLARAAAALDAADLARRHGRVSNLIGLIIEATGLQAEIGEVCLVGGDQEREPTGAGRRRGSSAAVPAEVVGFRDGRTLLMPLGELHGIGPGTKVLPSGTPFRVPVGARLLGRVIDGLGAPLDELDGGDRAGDETHARTHNGWAGADIYERAHGPCDDQIARTQAIEEDEGAMRSTIAAPPSAMQRPRIEERVALGVRALDSLVPCGRGQRLGIFAGSGVGKSSLLGMVARSTSATVNVIALVGERGREVREFIERDLGAARERSVVVVATSDQPALVRIKAAFTATTIAEHFRDRGHHVMLMMDSVTRFATAQREIGLAIGEPPATRGYTPSVFALLPRLLERAGTSQRGSITGLYTVLVDGDDMNEPIADAVRSILDGHIVLTRALAHAGHYPAIDVLQSVSRLITEIVPGEIAAAGQRLRAALAVLHEKEDLISIGAYRSGGDPLLDAALEHRPRIDAFLRQAVAERSNPAESDRELLALADSLERSLIERGSEIIDAEEVVAGTNREAPPPPPGNGGEAPDMASGAPAIPTLGLEL
ncbi:MAG TPA: FliI/YscN family ATPase [Solirubrobacteraceae bacterium]|jgi:flagellum-specific ATP synthase|nr:FliI/YscN family ATPase [Solirubrobacteraceae bacterium]